MKTHLLEIDGKAIAAFRAESAAEAWEFVNKEWFQDDLICFTSNGRPLWDEVSKLDVRAAEEWVCRRWEASRNEAIRDGDCDEPNDWVLFLVPVSDPDADEFKDEAEAA